MRLSTSLHRSLLILTLSSLVGCYGRFPLTNALYDWNGSVTHHRVGQSLIMWLLVLVPVYQACMVVDGVLINTIEYLSGRHIMANATASDHGYALQPLNTTNALLHLPLTNGSVTSIALFRVSPTRTEVRDAAGTLLGVALTQPDGTLRLCDANEHVVAAIPPHDLIALRAATQ